MELGTGIAIAGIWIGIGAASFGASSNIVPVAGVGAFATILVAICS